ncbi:FAD binding domain-containing protein [Kushneria phosphatilytica]|uniref:Xanthine dehydrogenase family protein subunit M n=1 Tax=Kushneria phosphatilytica TaxID=657387 RepID=A0A1S1NUG5_9GAMM|nr:xanthine dehydrogenase family protein subunit M [Kushneria phosphatilytica]OHV13823.1 molybdopterin dehydrogenase [Kushneria phosphatilytica]QEL10377.1 xanthine dehydrogenase family protein subunit M [Kushneria phosphatilytica]
MRAFDYHRAADSEQAIRVAAGYDAARYLGGGTNLVDLMREHIEQPATLIDITALSQGITETTAGGLLIGAGVTNSALAADHRVRQRYPMLARALLSGASAQIRNMATVGGNVLQRTRCVYFYDTAAHCNKREPGAGCDALEGFNRNHAILGASPACVSVHPSDMSVALVALDARVHLEGPAGKRTMAFVDFHRLPGERPDIETELAPHELITAIELPALPLAARSTYRKVRDRASYAFALVSVAAAVEVTNGIVSDVRLALGGVAHKPWRAIKAEQAMVGQPATDATLEAATEAELAEARPLRDNGFKIELARRVMVSVLTELMGERS